jgi:hypothetical protein
VGFFAFVLALAGLAPVLFFVMQSLLPLASAASVPDLIPELVPAGKQLVLPQKLAWLPAERLPELALAILGVMLMIAADTLGQRQRYALYEERRRRADARRRVHHYRAERVEPSLRAEPEL